MQQTLDHLSDAFYAFTKQESLPQTLCADEMLIECTLTPAQREWLTAFVRLWDASESLIYVTDETRSNGPRL